MDELANMEHVECNTDVGRNFINVDDIEDFANFLVDTGGNILKIMSTNHNYRNKNNTQTL